MDDYCLICEPTREQVKFLQGKGFKRFIFPYAWVNMARNMGLSAAFVSDYLGSAGMVKQCNQDRLWVVFGEPDVDFDAMLARHVEAKHVYSTDKGVYLFDRPVTNFIPKVKPMDIEQGLMPILERYQNV